MKRPRRKIYLVVLILCAVAALWFADEYPLLRFRGDATFSGGPVFGYFIKMRPIPFAQPGQYIFHFRGLPNQKMSLLLYAQGKTGKNREELTHLGTEIDAFLSDQTGHAVCKATGPLTPYGLGHGGWILMSAVDEAAYWSEYCNYVPLKPSASYTLSLRISNVDPKTPKINLLPVLEGGQHDLP